MYNFFINTLIFNTMRTKNLFKILFAASLAVFSVSTFAQTTSGVYTLGTLVDSTSGANEVTEYVTVGATMPYAVNPDANILNLRNTGVFKPSEFYWNVDDAGSLGTSWTETNYTIRDTNAAALTLSGAGNGNNAFPYTLDSIVSVHWLTTGAYKLWTNESPVSNTAGISACAGTPSSLTVHVLAKPTITWTDGADSASGGCGVAGVQTILVQADLTGSDRYSITYDSTYYLLNGTVSSSGTKTVAYDGGTSIFVSEANSDAAHTITSWAPAGGTYGYVKYTITKLSDRISRKSLANGVGGNNGNVFGSTPAAPGVNTDGTLATIDNSVYTVYSLPAPSARPVRHVTNLGW